MRPETQQHIRAQRVLRKTTAAAVTRMWDELPGYDREHVAGFVKRAVPLVMAAQQRSAAQTDAYLARVMNRAPKGVDPAKVTGSALRAGVDPDDVYARPFKAVWTALKDGTMWADAVAIGRDRLDATVETDIQNAMRSTASEIGVSDESIYGYERVTDGNACELCLIASTQRYHTGDLMPIHDRCGCSVEPITEPTDRIVNRERYEEITGKGSDVEVAVEQHGELGPVLANADHNFKSL